MIDLIIGGQFGSEGKGSVISWLGKNYKYDLAIRITSPNSGHTVINGNKIYKLRQLPSIWPFQDTDLYLPAASIIDIGILRDEWVTALSNGFKGRLTISPQAVIVEAQDHILESTITTGTTGSGTGSARSRKILRTARVYGTTCNQQPIKAMLYNSRTRILLETSQGYGLSLNGDYYPYVTSIDINPYHALSDSEVPYGIHNVNIWLVIRTYPIRIAGNSGPLLNEINWETLRKRHGNHIQGEITTVTNKIRRVGEPDFKLIRNSVERYNPQKVVLTFFDYLFPSFIGGRLSYSQKVYLKDLQINIGRHIDYIGYGPGKLYALHP